jgi:hypothetical protein
MSLSADRIAQAALSSLEASGLAIPSDVQVGSTGKTGLELLLSALAKAIVDEIVANGEVTVTLEQSLASWMGQGVVVAMDGGASLKTTLTAADAAGAYDTSKGTMA